MRRARPIIGLLFVVVVAGVVVASVDWHEIVTSVDKLSLEAVTLATLGILATQLFSTTRFWVLIRSMSAHVNWWRAFRANLAGQVGSLVMVQLVGQMVGRQGALLSDGVRPATLAMTTLIERGLVATVGLAGFLGGVVILFSGEVLAQLLRDVAPVRLLSTMALALAVSFLVGATATEKRLVAWAFTRRAGLLFITAGWISVIGWACMLTAFTVLVLALAPNVEAVDVIAASAIVSFAAALPISINGWGVREVAAIWAYGAIGVPLADAVVASVTVGVLSLGVVLALSPLLIRRRHSQREAFSSPNLVTVGSFPPDLVDQAGAWCLGIGVAAGILFQFHAEVAGTPINVNLADPLALLAFSVVLLHAIVDKRLPSFRVNWLLGALLLATVVLLFSFAHGVLDFGLTQWALTNRLLGWLVLLGYFCAGAHLVAVGGEDARGRLFETLLVAAATVVLLETFMRLGVTAGLLDMEFHPNFQGYSANRNAFAFALCFSIGLALCVLRTETRGTLYRWAMRASLALAMFGIWASQSRAGIGTLCVILVYLIATQPRIRRDCLLSLGGALGVTLAVHSTLVMLPGLLESPVSPVSPSGNAVQPGGGQLNLMEPTLVQEGSDGERWLSIVRGLELWREHPLLGGGLGSFVHEHAKEYGSVLVIHNTLVWMLAEMGVVGAVAFLVVFVGLAFTALREGLAPDTDWRRGLLICLVTLAVFSLVHDMFYQRVFWLVLGALLAVSCHGKPMNSDLALACEGGLNRATATAKVTVARLRAGQS